jgi:hypothetical protein
MHNIAFERHALVLIIRNKDKDWLGQANAFITSLDIGGPLSADDFTDANYRRIFEMITEDIQTVESQAITEGLGDLYRLIITKTDSHLDRYSGFLEWVFQLRDASLRSKIMSIGGSGDRAAFVEVGQYVKMLDRLNMHRRQVSR